MTGRDLLVVSDLTKRFGDLVVSRNINFRIDAGARHALIGPNGAGKTTFVNMITGVLAPSSGHIRFEGAEITAETPERRVTRGIGRTFQINSLFQSMTVAENISLAVSAQMRIDSRLTRPLYNRPDLLLEVERLLKLFQLEPIAGKNVADVAYGQRRLVELALALALKPKMLLLDEPAAGLPKRDSGRLLELLLRLPQDIAVLVIEHDMQLVFNFAKRITVMFEGSILAEGDPAEIRANPQVRDVYLGHRPHE